MDTRSVAGTGPPSAGEGNCVSIRPQVLNAKVVVEKMSCDVFDSGPERENDAQPSVSLSSSSPLATRGSGR